jgi:hypothetical protein
MGTFLIIAAVCGVLFTVIRPWLRYAFDFQARYDRWYNPALAVGSIQNDIHTRVIQELINRHTRLRSMGIPNSDRHMIAIENAILGGLGWMRKISLENNPSILPTDPHYLAALSTVIELITEKRKNEIAHLGATHNHETAVGSPTPPQKVEAEKTLLRPHDIY